MKRTSGSHPASEVECSVVVPTHRGAHRLPELLEALVAQDYAGTWELIVVVDGAVDNTPQLLESYRNRLPLKPVILESPGGLVAAMNGGIAGARGRIIIRCDDDLTPSPSFLRLHMRHHAGTETVAVIGPTRDIFPDSAYAKAYGRAANQRSLAAAYARDESYRWVGWAANNSVSAQVLRNLNGFDPRFVYGQDSELGYRIAECGIRMVVDAELETPHRGPTTTVQLRAARAFVSGASRRLFDLVHPGAHPPAPPPEGLKSTLWRALVRGTAAGLRTREAYGRVGRAVDRVMGWIPVPLASRIIALLVESAGRSGVTHGSDDLALYKGQKSSELLSEIAGRR